MVNSQRAQKGSVKREWCRGVGGSVLYSMEAGARAPVGPPDDNPTLSYMSCCSRRKCGHRLHSTPGDLNLMNGVDNKSFWKLGTELRAADLSVAPCAQYRRNAPNPPVDRSCSAASPRSCSTLAPDASDKLAAAGKIFSIGSKDKLQ
jgi:hypothetical protein